MKASERDALIAIPASMVLGLLVGLAGSDRGGMIGGIPLFALLVGLAFVIQWGAFLPAYLGQTERFFDLTGSLTNVSIFTLAILLSPEPDARAVLLFVLVTVWAIRLGSFLFRRIRKAGADDRFEEIKPSALRFLSVWTLQGLWVTLTGAAALAAITSVNRKAIDLWAGAGFLVWVGGFVMEVVADTQKRRFSARPANRGRFITTGLWSRSRHPNYLGEITLWIGIALIAVPVLQGWQWVVLISPLFVAVLLIRVSGIPLLEQKADRRWGGQEEYEAYKRRTPVLIPRL
jgi:steroid 5-alpha reductase family enzyme